jgi:superfamily II DNA/RNA helicase
LTSTTTPPETPALKTFADFGVDDRICDALADAGILNPFPIQELTLPLAIAGADIIGQARTGTGKTLAFGIPLAERALRDDSAVPAPSGLVIVPTRELCLQVRDDLAAAAAKTGLAVLAVYGGKSIDAQVDALTKGAHLVVGTPGRLLDLLRRGSLNLSQVSALVLDEADEMLDLGFLPDVEQLIEATAEKRQTLLFSATMPSAVVALARRYMNKPTFMRADVEEVHIAPETAQHFFSCHRMDKPAVLARILQSPGRGRSVVFTRTKRMADMLVEELRELGVAAQAIHSDLRQEARERALKAFRSGKTDVLVATEVAARGLDITDVTHVVNYDCPDDEKMYLHRIGRTGRAGAAGVAVTLAVWNELARLEMIKKALGISEETHEVFSTSPILEELFNLPPRGSARREPQLVSAQTDTADATQTDESTEPADGAAPPSRGGGSRRRSRGGGRPRSRAAADSTAQPTAAEPALEQPQQAALPDEADAADVADETDDQVSDDAAQAPATAPDTGEGDVIRRVRTRTRGGTTPKPPAAPVRSPQEPRPSESRPPRRNQSPSRGEGGRPSSSQGRRGRSSGSGSGSDRRDGGRSTDRRPPRARKPAVDADTARGGGRPRLARPLIISYLP